MSGIIMSSVQRGLGTRLQRGFNKELSRDRRFATEQGVNPYTHWNQIATAAYRMHGCSSTGQVLTIRNPNKGASSYGLRFQATSTLVTGSVRWKTNFAKAWAAWASPSSSGATLGVTAMPTLAQTGILGASTVIVRNQRIFGQSSTVQLFSTTTRVNILALGY